MKWVFYYGIGYRHADQSPMVILAIYPGHNAAVCILRDGEVLLNIELERFSRIKHDYGYREDFVLHCLQRGGITIDQIDLLVVNRWHEKIVCERVGTELLPFDVPSTAGVERVEFHANLFGRPFPALAVNHHLAHVVCAFFTSPFDMAAALTIDGGGDVENASFARCIGNKIESYEPCKLLPLANWWSGLTMTNYRMPPLHEWDPGSGAGKLMALAAYAQPDAQIQELLDSEIKAGERRIGKYFYPRAEFAFNLDEDLSDVRSVRSQAVARAMQDITEQQILEWFNGAFDLFGSTNLCYAGGLALNCVANSRALLNSKFE